MSYTLIPISGKFNYNNGVLGCKIADSITFQISGIVGKKYKLFVTHVQEEKARMKFITTTPHFNSPVATPFEVVSYVDNSANYGFGYISTKLGVHPYYTDTAESDQIVLRFLTLGSDRFHHINHRRNNKDNVWNLHLWIEDPVQENLDYKQQEESIVVPIQVYSVLRPSRLTKQPHSGSDVTVSQSTKGMSWDFDCFRDALLGAIYNNLKMRSQHLDRPALMKLYFKSLELFPPVNEHEHERDNIL